MTNKPELQSIIVKNSRSFSNRVKNMVLVQIMHSHWCKLIFIALLAVGYFLIPKQALQGRYQLWIITFIFTFAASSTCAVRNLKDNMEAKIQAGVPLLSILASMLGLSAVQFCSVNAVMCGSTLGFGLLSFIMPQFLFRLLHQHAVVILIMSSLLQVLALYLMGCLQIKRDQISTCRTKSKDQE